MAFDIMYYPPPRMGFRRSSFWNINEWPHLASLYASTHNLDEDGKHPDPMMGQDNVFDPSEPYGAYRYYVQPSTRSEFSIEEPIYAHRSVYKDEESRSSDYTSGDSFRRGTTCRVLLCVFLVLSFIGVVIAAITLAVLLSRTTTPLRSKPGPAEEFESTAKIFARDFNENLRDNSSEEFKLLEKEFCTAIEQMFKDDDSPVKNAFSGCEVLEFINGSVQVRYRIKLASQSPDGLKMEEHIEKKLEEHFKKKANQLGPWQNLKFDPRFLEKFIRIEIATTTTVSSTWLTTTLKTTIAPTTIKTKTFLDTDITSTTKTFPSTPYITTPTMVNATVNETEFHTERPQEIAVENITLVSASSVSESSTFATEETISLSTTTESTVTLTEETERTTESTVTEYSTQEVQNYTDLVTNVTLQAERTTPSPIVSTTVPTTPEDLATTTNLTQPPSSTPIVSTTEPTTPEDLATTTNVTQPPSSTPIVSTTEPTSPEDLATTAIQTSIRVTDATTTAETYTTVDSVTKTLPLSNETTTGIPITERTLNVTQPEMTSREPEFTTETITVTDQNVTDQVPVNETIVKDVIFSTAEEAKRFPDDYVVDYYDYTTERDHKPTTDVATEMPVSSTEIFEQTTQVDVKKIENVTKKMDELNVTISPDHENRTHATEMVIGEMANLTTSMPTDIITAFKTIITTETQQTENRTLTAPVENTVQPDIVLTTEVTTASEATVMQDNLTTAHPKLFTTGSKDVTTESFVHITDKSTATTAVPEVSTKYSVTTDAQKDSDVTEETTTHVRDVSTAVSESTGIELTTASPVAVEIATSEIPVTSSKHLLETTAATQLDLTTTTNDTTEATITGTPMKSEESPRTDSLTTSEPLTTKAPWLTTTDESPITNRSATTETLITTANATVTPESLVNISSFTTKAYLSSHATTSVTASKRKESVTVQEETKPTSQNPMTIEITSEISVTSSPTGNKSEIVEMHTTHESFISTQTSSPGTSEYTLAHGMTTTQVPPKSFTTQTKLTTQTPAEATTADDTIGETTIFNPVDYYYYEETTTRKDEEKTLKEVSATTNQTLMTTEPYTSQPSTGRISTVQGMTDVTLGHETSTGVVMSTAKPVKATSTYQTKTSSADISSLIDNTTTVIPVKEITTTYPYNVTEIDKETSTSTDNDSQVIVITETLKTARVANVTDTPTSEGTIPPMTQGPNDTGKVSTTSKNISAESITESITTQPSSSVTREQREAESMSTKDVTQPTTTNEISSDTVTVTATTELLTFNNVTDNQSSQVSTTTERFSNETLEITYNITEVPAILTTSVIAMDNAAETFTENIHTESKSVIDATQPTTITKVSLDTVVEKTKVAELTTTKFDIDNQSTHIFTTPRLSNETFETTYNVTEEPSILTTSLTALDNATEHLKTESENITDFTSTSSEVPKSVNESERYNETTTAAVFETVKSSTLATETDGNFTTSNESLHVTTSKTAESAFIDEYSDSAFMEEFIPKNKTKLEETSVLTSANDSKTLKPTTSSPFATIELHFRLANVTLETPNEESNATGFVKEMRSTESPIFNESSTTNVLGVTETIAVNGTTDFDTFSKSSPMPSLNASEPFDGFNQSNLAPENTSVPADALATNVERREITENIIQNKSLDLTLDNANINESIVVSDKNESLINNVDAVTVGTEGSLNDTELSNLSQSIPGSSEAPALKETSTVSAEFHTQTQASTSSLNISATEETNISAENVTFETVNISETTITATPSTVLPTHDNLKINETTDAPQTTSELISNISETTQSSPTTMNATDMLNNNKTTESPQTKTTLTDLPKVNETSEVPLTTVDGISNLNETTEFPLLTTQFTLISNVNETTEALAMTTTVADKSRIEETTQITLTTTTSDSFLSTAFNFTKGSNTTDIHAEITTNAPDEISPGRMVTAAVQLSTKTVSNASINVEEATLSPDDVTQPQNGSTGSTTVSPDDVTQAQNGSTGSTTVSPDDVTQAQNGSSTISPDDVTQAQNGSTGSSTVSPDDVTQPQNGSTGSTTVSPDDVAQPPNGSSTVSPDDVTQPQNGSTGSTTVSPDDVTQSKNGSESSTDYYTSNLTDYYYDYEYVTESPSANKTVTKTTKSIIQQSTVPSPRANTTEHLVGSNNTVVLDIEGTTSLFGTV